MIKKFGWLEDEEERLALATLVNFGVLTPRKLRGLLVKEKPQSILSAFLSEKESSLKKEWLNEEIRKFGAKIVIFGDDNYPFYLQNISSPPLVLFVLGELDSFFELYTAGVVGSRKPTEYGQKMTKRCVSLLIENNWTVVSGLAFGIDSIAHLATLESGGRTIAVIPSGLDNIYPSSHRQLAKRIVEENGVVLTEVGFDQGKINRGSFPRRNRIIAGISKFLVVVEGSNKSGTLITASQAINASREVYAFPGRIDNPYSWAPNFLIQQGAKPIISFDDFSKELKAISHQGKKKGGLGPGVSLGDEERKILSFLEEKAEPLSMEEISQGVKMPLDKLFQLLSEMELKDLVSLNPVGKYFKK